MKYFIFDIETDGLNPSMIYCLSYAIIENGYQTSSGTVTEYSEMLELLNEQEAIVGHYIIPFDLPVLERIIDYKPSESVLIIDTFNLSQYLFPYHNTHGLEFWGRRLKVEKLEVDDWLTESIELYKERCEIDVKINVKLFGYLWSYISEIYSGESDLMMAFINYLNFKLRSIRNQEEVGIPLDIAKATEHYERFSRLYQEKYQILQKVMPADLGNVIKTRPKVMFRQDGSLSKRGISWFEFLKEHNLPYDTEEVKEDPNPGSVHQLKSWLYRLGWVPETFKMSKNTGKEVEQISLPFGEGLCPSVKALFKDNPVLANLEDFYVLKHRIDIIKGYLDFVDDHGLIESSASGYTKTLRLTHRKPIANLPKVSSKYGKECREVLIAPGEDYTMIGADISGLESATQDHFMYKYDPKYVQERRTEGFDPHLDIGLLSGLMSEEDVNFYKNFSFDSEKDEKLIERYNNLDYIRDTAKRTNFSATYGAGPATIARAAGLPLEEAGEMHEIYWTRNKAVKEVAKNAVVKTVRNTTWIKSPLSGFWLFLSSDKDRFSAINQNAGVFVFDLWYRYVSEVINPKGIYICLQYHDELAIWCKKEDSDFVVNTLYRAMDRVNEALKLNVIISISVKTGSNYAIVH